MTRLSAAAIVDGTWVDIAFLSFFRKDLNISRRFFQSGDHFDHITTRVLVGSVDASKLQISPVNIIAVNRDSEGINCG